MNKQELRERISSMPLFEMRRIKVKQSVNDTEDAWNNEAVFKAICETGTSEPVAFVGKRYNLLQFKEVFLPIIDNIVPEIDGYVVHYGGYAYMALYPEITEFVDGDLKFGIVATNSVDCSSAVSVQFVVKNKDGRQYSIPPKVAGLKRNHKGNIKNLVQNYMGMIGPVQVAWKSIIDNFPNYKVVETIDEASSDQQLEFGAVIQKLAFGKRLNKILKIKMDKQIANGNQYTLWDIFVDAIDILSSKKFKSDVHRQKRVDNLHEHVRIRNGARDMMKRVGDKQAQVYSYDCFITKSTRYGLFDTEGDLRCTSPNIDGVVVARLELGWGLIREIRMTNKGILFGKEVNEDG